MEERMDKIVESLSRRNIEAEVRRDPLGTEMILNFGLESFGIKLHFMPVGNAAPPLPLNPDFFTYSIISSGFIPSAFLKAEYPPFAS